MSGMTFYITSVGMKYQFCDARYDLFMSLVRHEKPVL